MVTRAPSVNLSAPSTTTNSFGKIFPVTLGMGKRLFDTGTLPASYTLIESQSSPHGVMIATFKRAGEVQTGSFV